MIGEGDGVIEALMFACMGWGVSGGCSRWYDGNMSMLELLWEVSCSLGGARVIQSRDNSNDNLCVSLRCPIR